MLSVVAVKAILVLGPCFPCPVFWKLHESSPKALVWQVRNFQIGDENVAAFLTHHPPCPASILAMGTVASKMQHILKKELQHLREETTFGCFFVFFFFKYTGKSVCEFLAEKFSPSKLKSAAGTYCVKVFSIHKLAGLQLK